ncbi:MAG: hypothetical protein OEU32_03760 [Acidimicrobiia bacterium]|nr:hypothetical protein [Acidimicrobiia bacterium]
MIPRPTFSRRSVLLGGLATVAAACGGGNGDSATPAVQTDDGTVFLQPGFADGLRSRPFLVAGRELVAPIFLAGGTGRPLQVDEIPASIDLEIRQGDQVVSTQTLPVRGDGILTPHYSPVFDVDVAGDFDAVSIIGGNAVGFSFRVGEAGETGHVQLGDTLRPVDTPTFAEPAGVDPVCTQLPDPCPFHEMTLTDAIGSGRPIVYLVATPAFCQTAICGPVVGMLTDRLAGRDDVAVVHAEVYRSVDVALTPDGVTESVTVYDLDYEPMQLCADAGGVVRSRLDFAWDTTELDRALAAIGIS